MDIFVSAVFVYFSSDLSLHLKHVVTKPPDRLENNDMNAKFHTKFDLFKANIELFVLFLCGAWWRTHRVWELLYDLSTKALHVELGVGVLELNLTNVIMAIKLQLITLYEYFKSVNVSGTLIVTSNLSILILLLSLSLRTRVVFITTVRTTCRNCCLFELTLKICLNPRQICVNRSFAVLCLEDTHHIDMVPEW